MGVIIKKVLFFSFFMSFNDLFPFDEVRPSQKVFMEAVFDAVSSSSNLIVHAPTGLGKTAASLAPALSLALEQDLTVFFLTSRHTQHEIALKTLEAIRDKHGVSFQAVDVIGKKWMCLQPGVDNLPSQEFTEFCRALREDGKCGFFSNLRKGERLTTDGKLVLDFLKRRSPVKSSVVVDVSSQYGVCPYYVSMELAKKAKVIIGDYYYLFHPRVRERFFARSNNSLDDAVIIVDEAHNLPDRIKSLASSRLSSVVLRRALKEAQKFGLLEVSSLLSLVNDFFSSLIDRLGDKEEMLVSRDDLVSVLSSKVDYDDFVDSLLFHGDNIREQQKFSFVGSVGDFLSSWVGPDEGFVRIFSRRKGLREEIFSLSYRCLDPAVVSRPIFSQARSSILMSGTLTPTSMYKAVLGLEDARELSFPSPFPNRNRLNLIVPKTTTKFSSRNEDQFRSIADVLSRIVKAIPGNVAVFFPSYHLLREVGRFFSSLSDKTVFEERQEMSSSEKQEFIDKFRSYKDSGAVLLGVISGNFGEGVDLPGDELRGVVIVGLPLQKPDLETEALIKYYDERFGKGWDFGYLFPAFNKALQSAGRCIRSESDRGVIVFLDERYAWPNYRRCFPDDWDVSITLLYEKLIKEFFSPEQSVNKG